MIAIKKIIKKIYKIFFNETPTEKFNREEQENYQKWIINNEPDENELVNQRKIKFKFMPKISIVIPLYNTPEKYFKELLDSLNEQTYENWELCLADGSKKENEYIKKTINLYGHKIKYKCIETNKGISGNTNEALKLATGDYIALMDQDDILPKFALYEIVKIINENDNVDFIYSDEDKIYEKDGKKIRTSPHFKQDYAIDTLRSYNYICHFSVFSKELISKIGKFNSEFDGSQDYDFILRATENANKIIHIPKILYNWRISESSVASGSSAKPYAYEAAKKAILASLERNDIHGAKVSDSKILGLYNVTYPILKKEKISIIIPNKNNKRQLKKCINSIMKSTYDNFEIIIVDNSKDKNILKYYNKIKENKKIKIELTDYKEYNYFKLCNYGANKSNGEYLVFINSDIKIGSKDWLEKILSNCQRKEIGCIGGKILYKNKKIKHAGIALNLMGLFGNIHRLEKSNSPGYFGRIMIQQNVMAISSQLIGVSRKIFEKVNGFDFDYKDGYCDVDFCLKINDIDKLVVYNPYIIGYDNETLQLKDNEDKTSNEEFLKKWNKYFIKEDRYFNPNFRKDVSNMRINPNKI